MNYPLVLLVAAAVGGFGQDLTGDWVDSQANRVQIGAQGSNITVECPRCTFENDERVFEVPFKFTGPLKDGEFEGTQGVSGGNLVVRLKVAASGMIRETVNFPGVDTPFDLVLGRMTNEAATGTKASRVVLELKQPSASIGKWAGLWVSLVDSRGRLVAPEKDTLVQLTAQGGAPLPGLARISHDVPRVPAGVVPAKTKASVEASSPGLQAGAAVATGCEQGEVGRLKMSVTRTRAVADGKDAVPVSLTLVDQSDTPVSDGKPKQIGFDVGGVARVARGGGADAVKTVTIAAGECAEARFVVADDAGEGTVAANFLDKADTKKLLFQPRLTMLAMGLALLGGLLGGFVAAGRNYAAVSRWKWRRWVYWLIGSTVGAVAVYLAYFYGLLQSVAGFPSGAGFALLAGLLGGFLGAAALEKLTGAAVKV